MYICGYLTIAMMTFKPIRRQIIFSLLQQRVNDYDKCVNFQPYIQLSPLFFFSMFKIANKIILNI